MNAEMNGVCELVLESDDLGAMAEFYERIGLSPVSRGPEWAWFDAGHSCRVGIWTPGEKGHGDRGGSHVHFALSVEPGHIDALPGRLREAGIAFEGPVEHDGGDRSIYLSDPAGNRVEFWDYFRRGGTEEGEAPG
jgi:catechol-2,3-dioxygenase